MVTDRDEMIETPSPSELAQRVAEIVAVRPRFSEDEICDALAATGVPPGDAARAYWLVQLAWSRHALTSLGVKFPMADFFCIDANGDVVSEGRYDEEPVFVAAVALIPQYPVSEGFKCLVATSAESNAVRQAVSGGGRPQDQVCGLSYRFLAKLTPSGEQKVRRLMAKNESRLALAGGAAMPRLWTRIINWFRRRWILRTLRK